MIKRNYLTRVVSETRTNARAFPMSTIDGFTQKGLTKREHFAAMAMQGLICQSSIAKSAAIFAKESAVMADALIEELNKGGE